MSDLHCHTDKLVGIVVVLVVLVYRVLFRAYRKTSVLPAVICRYFVITQIEIEMLKNFDNYYIITLILMLPASNKTYLFEMSQEFY